MESFVAFLRDNWKFLLEIFIPVLSMVFLLIIKKRAKINFPDNIISQMFVFLPGWIEDAEKIFGAKNGSQKLKYVLKLAVDYLADSLGLSDKEVLRCYGDQIITDIEAILSTPQKKGDQ